MSDAGAAVATDTSATPPTPATPATDAPAAWYADRAPEDVGWLQSKGWADPDTTKVAKAATDAYRNIEKHFGIPGDRLFAWPKAEDGLDSVWSKLGVPTKAEDYTFANFDWQDGEDAKLTKEMFAELGVKAHQTEEQLGVILDFFKEVMGAQQSEMDGAREARIAEANDIIKQSWGAKFDENNALADIGMAKIAEMMEAAGNTRMVGRTEGALKLLTDGGYGDWGRELLRVVGRGLGEDRSAVNSASGSGQPMTREEARFRLQDARNLNTDLGQRYARGEPSAEREVRDLIRMAHQGEEGW